MNCTSGFVPRQAKCIHDFFPESMTDEEEEQQEALLRDPAFRFAWGRPRGIYVRATLPCDGGQVTLWYSAMGLGDPDWILLGDGFATRADAAKWIASLQAKERAAMGRVDTEYALIAAKYLV